VIFAMRLAKITIVMGYDLDMVSFSSIQSLSRTSIRDPKFGCGLAALC
jgi:hypothetical protein